MTLRECRHPDTIIAGQNREGLQSNAASGFRRLLAGSVNKEEKNLRDSKPDDVSYFYTDGLVEAHNASGK